MHVRAVAGQEVSQVGAEAPEADLPVQAQRASQSHEVPFERPVAEDVQRHLAACLLRFGEDPQHVPMILDRLEVADRDEVGERLPVGRSVVRGHEVVDDGIGHGRGLGKPAQQGLPRPLRDEHHAVDLRDHLAFELADRAVHGAIALDLVLVGPFVGLGRPEVHREHDALVRSLPGAQRGPGRRRILDVDHAVAHLGQCLAERACEEHRMPMAVPHHSGGSAAQREREAESEDRHRERPRAGERGDDRRRRALLGKVPTQLPRWVCTPVRPSSLSMVAMTRGTVSTSGDASFTRREWPPASDLTLSQSVGAGPPIRH